MKHQSWEHLLLGGRFAPITSEIGFIELEPSAVVSAFAEWHGRLRAPFGVRVSLREVHGSLADALSALLPLTSVERRRYLFAPSASQWTAYFDNGRRGTDAFAHVGSLAEQLSCRGMRVVAVPNNPPKLYGNSPGTYGGTILEVYSQQAAHPLGVERTIAAVNDGGRWTFDESGPPYEFEHTERYQERFIRRRFTFDMLDEYLQHFGIRVFDDSFYLPEGRATLVEDHGPKFSQTRCFTLEEEQSTMRIHG